MDERVWDLKKMETVYEIIASSKRPHIMRRSDKAPKANAKDLQWIIPTFAEPKRD